MLRAACPRPAAAFPATHPRPTPSLVLEISTTGADFGWLNPKPGSGSEGDCIVLKLLQMNSSGSDPFSVALLPGRADQHRAWP